MNILTKSILTTLAALAVVSTTRAETFPIFEDTFGSPTKNTIAKTSGAAKTISVSAKSTAYINFAVGSGQGDAAFNIDPANVASARLTLYIAKVAKPGTIKLHKVTSAFSETFAEKTKPTPSIDPTPFETITVGADLSREYYIVDVTDLVKSWLTTPSTEHGIAIVGDATANITIATKEGAGSGHPALIELDYNSTTGPVAGTSGTFTGDVGIGTTAPAAKLHVFGTGLGSPATSGSTQSPGLVARLRDGGNILLDIGGSGGGGFWLQCTDGNNLANNFPLTLNPNGGNVGIGKTNPNASLDVNGGVKVTGVNGYTFNSGDEDGGIFSPANGIITVRTENAERLRVDGNGNIGIGTDNPTQAKLVVAGSSQAPSSYTTEAFLDTAGAFNVSTPGENHQTSIFADAFIRSNQGFIVSSDARTKTVLNVSDSAADLAALTQIQITDYQYKDTVSRGLQVQKKVIAQQIEPLCPQAIVKSTDVVPDIYKAATAKDGWIELSTDLKKGERVRIMGDKTSAIHEVLEVREGAFRTDFQPAGEKVFVYGREVNDFRTVDYDAIAMLNVSATQELAKQLAAKDATIAALEAKLAAFGEKLAALETANSTRTARSEAPAPQPASVEVK